MEDIILKLFGIGILISIGLGLIFPYVAISIMPLSFVFLFLLMILAGLTIDWRKLRAVVGHPKELLIGNLFLFILFPLVQFLLAKLLLVDSQFLYGVVFSSVTPVAIVAPFFTGIINGDKELSFLLLVTSMLLAPFVSPLVLRLYAGPLLTISTRLIFMNMMLLIPLPLLISFLVARYLPSLRGCLNRHMALLNLICLSVLIFILFGVSVSKINLHYVTWHEIAALIGLGFFQDFGILFLAGIVFPWLFLRKKANGLKISSSIRNIAIAAGILLFYDPKAALAPSLGFIAHAFMFNAIPLFRRFLE